jgi:hypothetical protein
MSYVLRGDVLEPEGVPVFREVPHGVADPDHEPAPVHVVKQLRTTHKCEPYPSKHPRHHIGIWQLYVCRLPVTSQAKVVALVLAQHWSDIRPSVARISALSGIATGSVDNGIAVLRFAGLLVVDNTKGRTSNRYRPHYPERDVTAEEVAEFVKWSRLPVKPPDESKKKRRPRSEPPPTNSPGGGESTPHTVKATLHDVGSNRPHGGDEVINEAGKEVVAEVEAQAPPAARSFLDECRHARELGLPAPKFNGSKH